MLWTFLFTWLIGLPIVERFVRFAQLYLRAVLELLLDEHNQPRQLSPADLLRADAGLRRAHALIDMAVWIEACARAGVPHLRGVRAAPYTFASRVPDHAALFKRAVEIENRINRMHVAAQRWADRMRQDPLRLTEGGLSQPAFPAKAGTQPARGARFLTTGKLGAFEASGFESGSPPARGTRLLLMDAAPRDGPALAGILRAER